MNLKKRNFTSLADFSPGEMRIVLDLARRIRKEQLQRSLRGKVVAGLFLSPSLQMRVALEAATAQLGAHLVHIGPGEPWALATEEGVPMYGSAVEHVRDAAGALSAQVDAIALRAPGKMESWAEDREDPVLKSFLKYSEAPVINLGSSMFSPVQALADLFTMEEKLMSASERAITVTWTYHPKGLPMNSVNSIVLAAALSGMRVTLAHPGQYELDGVVLDQAQELARQSGGSFAMTEKFTDAFYNAEVVYCASWASKEYYGKPDQEKVLREKLKHWTVDARHMSLTRDAAFMYPLPIRRNITATDEVIDAPYSLVQAQSRNLLPVMKALLSLILEDAEYE